MPLQQTGFQPLTLSPRASITAVHGYLPPDLLTNSELARMVDTSDAWITERTGIKERHILRGEGLGTSHMAAEAVRGLLQKTATKPEEVDLLICATTTPDMQFPSTANMICDMVGIRNIGSFDVQAACSGFLYSLTIATQFIATGAASITLDQVTIRGTTPVGLPQYAGTAFEMPSYITLSTNYNIVQSSKARLTSR